MKRTFMITLLIVVLKVISSAIAANHYVRSDAKGNGSGSDWTNAFKALPATLVRGDTYYIADGSYGGVEFDNSANGTQYITIKKAIETDHGTDLGWQFSYGDGQAEFNGRMYFSQPYYHIDGQVGKNNSDHGIYIHQTSLSPGGKCIDIRNTHHIIIRHVEAEHAGMDMEGGNNADIIYMIGSNNLTFQYIYAHDVTRVIVFARSTQYVTFDRCYFERCQNNVGIHGEGVSWDNSGELHLTFKFCVFKDIEGMGVIVIGLDHSSFHSEIDIYGNVFYTTIPVKYTCTDGVVTSCGGNSVSNARFYNNSIIGISSPWNAVGIVLWNSGSNNVAYNNLIYNLGKQGSWSNCEHDYNLYYNAGNQTEAHMQIGVAELFMDINSYDFRLKSATRAGTELQSPYNEDLDGNSRGEDEIWDRGAFEYDYRVPVNLKFTK